MTENEFMEIHNKPFNYVQADGRLVKHYNNTALIYNAKTKEIVSCYGEQRKLRNDWNDI